MAVTSSLPVLYVGDGKDVRGAPRINEGAALVVSSISPGAEALSALERDPAAVVLDLACGHALLTGRAIRARRPEVIMIALADPEHPDSSIQALRAGITELVPRGSGDPEITSLIARLKEFVAEGVMSPGVSPITIAPDAVFGRSAAMREVMELALRASSSRAGVLIRGERGTGREMVARAIHRHGVQADGPFIKVDCAKPCADLEVELFGVSSIHREDGARTERRAFERITRSSQLHAVMGGSLFLEQLIEMPARVQARLARLLRDREAVCAEDGQHFDFDVRLIAAVEPSFGTAVEDGRVRTDLTKRLGITIDLCSLRHRREDIPILANYFLQEACRASGVPVKTFTSAALTLLAALPWQGNARELVGLLEGLTMLVPRGVIRLEDVLANVRLDGGATPFVTGATLREARARFEREYIVAVLEQHRGRIGEAARALGIQRTNLYRKLRHLHLARTRTRAS